MSEPCLAEAATPLYTPIADCRLCEGTNLESVFDLGVMALTGVFPKPGEAVDEGPLELMRCGDCGLVQLAHNYDPARMFGPTYGYRSGLNPSMVAHLRRVAEMAEKLVDGLERNSIVLDIGCNDGTLLRQYRGGPIKVGIDPLCKQFDGHLGDGMFFPELFSAARIKTEFPNNKVKIVTSIAMFYDLERPVEFARDVASILAPDGVWVIEVADLAQVLRNLAYDGICHEHLEYYGLAQLTEIGRRAGLKIIEWRCTDTNGGSILIVFAHANSSHRQADLNIDDIAWRRDDDSWTDFRARVAEQTEILQARMAMLAGRGRRVIGYGASTKGNVLLQHTGIGADLDCIGEVNADKVGRVTPGTNIPIVSEMEARRRGPDVFLVLPWHFREYIVAKERLRGGPDLLFPLPRVEMVRLG